MGKKPKPSSALARRREQGRERSRRARNGKSSKYWVLARHSLLEELIERGDLSPAEALDRNAVGICLARLLDEWSALQRFWENHGGPKISATAVALNSRKLR